MADNTNEEHLDDLTNIPSDNPPDEITSTNDTETINPNQETENMEVHKHPHNVTHKKKWGEYLLEFLMIFLAVFLGFWAEYQLEHKIERDREIIYIKSMIEDLRKDTGNLTTVIKDFNKLDFCIDTFLTMYPKLASGYNDTLNRNLQKAEGYPDFIYSDRTIQQLKNSGALRLLRKKNAVDGIVDYDYNIRDLVEVDIPFLTGNYAKYSNLRRELIDYQNLNIDKKSKSISQLEKGNKNYLLKSDKESLGIFYNNLIELKHYYIIVREKEIALKKEATELIMLLKKEYTLENE